MAGEPAILLHHSVRGTPWLDEREVRDAIADHDLDDRLTVALTPEDTREAIPDVDIVLSSYLSSDELALAERLSWIQALSAGVDTLPLSALAARDVLLTSAAGAHAQPVAEHVLGAMLLFERRFDRAIEMHERGAWNRFTGGELADKTLGVIGLGAIGRRVAELAAAVGMTVIGSKRDPTTSVPTVERVYGPDELASVLVAADYLLVACPLTDATSGLIGREELGILPDEAVVLNVARGPIVEESALVEALQQRVIRGAALDVFEREPLSADSPLFGLDNVLLTPHNAGASPALPGRIAAIFAANYARFVEDDVDGMRNVEQRPD